MNEQQIRQRLRDQGQSDEEIEAELDLIADDARRDKQDREVHRSPPC